MAYRDALAAYKVPRLIRLGLVGLATLPPEIVVRLNSEIRAHLTEPEVAQRIRALGSEPAPGSPSDFRDRVQRPAAVEKRGC